MRLLATLVLLPSCLLLYPWALALIPFYTYALIGIGLPHDQGWMFSTTLVELAAGGGFLVRWMLHPKDGISIFLFFLPFLALPGLANAGNLPFSLALTLCLVTATGFYGYWRDHMGDQVARRIPQIAFAVWLSLGFLIKFYEAASQGGPWWMQRSGGIWAANHGAGVLILLLPFVRSRLLLAGTVLYVLTSNSRGVYLTATIIAIGYCAIGYWRPVVKGFALTVLAIAIGYSTLDAPLRASVSSFLTERFFAQGASLDQGASRVLAGRVKSDERWDIYQAAARVAQETSYEGVGVGGFQFSITRLGWSPDYSNAHNLFLTAVVEGGVLFAAGFMGLLVYMTVLAVRVDSRVAVTLAGWCVYGLFNGELWEAAGIGTAGDYLTLLFVLAFVTWRAHNVLMAAGRTRAITLDPASSLCST